MYSFTAASPRMNAYWRILRMCSSFKVQTYKGTTTLKEEHLTLCTVECN
jgi:hypothetical protein